METAAIRYRVADFLKQFPPFTAMQEQDLLDLARHGRVKFFEANEYIVWQGASRLQVYVIQQGTVSLWDEEGSDARLCDVRGAGDMLGIDQFDDIRTYLYSARSASDVLTYAFPADEFEALILKYPSAKQYVSAYGSVTAEFRSTEERRGPQNMFLQEVASEKKLFVLDDQSTIQDAVRFMLATGADAAAALDPEQRVRAVLTPRSFLEWIAQGGGDAQQPVATLFNGPPSTTGTDATVTDGVLSMGATDTDVVAITSDGSAQGRLHAIITARNLAPVFGDQPADILHEIRRAQDAGELRELNQRARALTLRYLTNAESSDWLARFTACVDETIVSRTIAMAVPEELSACWCFSGASGRRESLTSVMPQVILVIDDQEETTRVQDAYRRVLSVLEDCGYIPHSETAFAPPFYAAGLAEWKERYGAWVRDPILRDISVALSLFDLRPIWGRFTLLKEIETSVINATTPDFLQVLANDCLSNLPPLTFFHDAVVDETGAETAVFQLEHSALRPLVDVGRVFGMASKTSFGRSTLDRFATARTLLPKHASIFREASETLRIVLWQQGRTGISQGTSGAELPPALLSRYDKQLLRSGFRSILRLLEFTYDWEWLKTL